MCVKRDSFPGSDMNATPHDTTSGPVLLLSHTYSIEWERRAHVHSQHSGSTILSSFVERKEAASKDSIVWNSELHLTANTPPDAGFHSIAAMAQSAELQLASATKSESYIGTRTTHHSDSC